MEKKGLLSYALLHLHSHDEAIQRRMVVVGEDDSSNHLGELGCINFYCKEYFNL